MKKTFLLIIFSLFIFNTNFVSAQKSLERPSSRKIDRTITSESALGKITSTPALKNDTSKIDDLKSRASLEIKRRTESLQKLITKINKFKRLSTAQKGDLSSQIQKQIDSLATLQAKISGETDLVTLKADVKSIVTDYRIYVFFIQDINLIAAAERIGTAADNLTLLSGKLETRITDAQSKGQDVTSLNAKYQDMQTNLTNAKTLIDEVNSKLSGLTVAGYPGNKTNLDESRVMLKQAFADIKAAYQDGFEIIRILKELKLFPTVTPSPTPSL